MKRYYLAYGSNLNVKQMVLRCPDAKPLGTGEIAGYRLLFKGSKSGAYLTIEPQEGAKVPVAVWEVSEADEKKLDRYEGFPAFYYKKELRFQYKDIRTGGRRTVNAFAYIMYENRPIGIPSDFYMRTCLEGYDAFFFDRKVLAAAYDKCREAVENEG